MKNIALLFVCFLGCAQAIAQDRVGLQAEIPTAKPDEVGMSAEKLARVDAAMMDSVEKNRIPGGIVIIARRGKIVHHKAYGLADLESKRPMATDSLIRIYSMTKAITSAAALMLHEEGKLDVNDPVSKYLPELEAVHIADGETIRPGEQTMTIVDLMRHTSGYTHGKSDQPLHDQAFRRLIPTSRRKSTTVLQQNLAELPLAYEPGTDWSYGISTDVLGRLVEVVSGQSLDEFFKTRFFEPLGMIDTGFFVPADQIHRLATLYRSNEKGSLKVPRIQLRDFSEPPSYLSGGGGLVSTTRDYMRFLMMIQQGGMFQGRRYLKPETIRLMTTNQVPQSVGWIKFDKVRTGVGYGLGFAVRVEQSDFDPDAVEGEYGWGGAKSTHYWVSPKDELIVVTMEQIQPYSFMTEFKIKGLIYDAIID